MNRLVLTLCALLALAAPAAAQTIKYISGFEAGDTSELVTVGAANTVQTGTVLTGAYSLKVPSGGGIADAVTALAADQVGARFRYQTDGFGTQQIVQFRTATPAAIMGLAVVSNVLEVAQSGGNCATLATTDGTTTLSTNTAYVIRIVFDRAAGGVVKVWLNDGLEINTTHSSACVASLGIDRSSFPGNGTGNSYYDDVLVQTGSTAQPPAGKLLARQGVEGTPTYTGWTKTTCTCSSATGETCSGTCVNNSVCCDWSQSPLVATQNASTSGNTAQTVLIGKFSVACNGTCNTSACCGHGAETIGSGDTINACKTAVIAKVSNASSTTNKIRRRIGAADTDTTVTLTTSDKYFDDGIWTASTANLDTAEAGFIQSAGSRTPTVEDVWIMCDSVTTTTVGSHRPDWLLLRGVGCIRPAHPFDPLAYWRGVVQTAAARMVEMRP